MVCAVHGDGANETHDGDDGANRSARKLARARSDCNCAVCLVRPGFAGIFSRSVAVCLCAVRACMARARAHLVANARDLLSRAKQLLYMTLYGFWLRLANGSVCECGELELCGRELWCWCDHCHLVNLIRGDVRTLIVGNWFGVFSALNRTFNRFVRFE